MAKYPYICVCGEIVEGGTRCECQIKADQLRREKHDRKRLSSSRRGYDRAWREARELFLIAFPKCRRCDEPATVVDHIVAHEGNMRLFWNKANWQPLCTNHHSSWKQRQERQERDQ